MLVAVAFTSCYKDEGNYDYHLLDEVRIDTTGTGIRSMPLCATIRSTWSPVFFSTDNW